MVKGDKMIVKKDGGYYELTVPSQKKARKPRISRSTVYNILNVAEKVAIVLSLVIFTVRQYKRIKQRCDKIAMRKSGDLKSIKRQRSAVPVKRRIV